jgi:hypothetical protein
MTSGFLRAGSSILSSASSMFGRYSGAGSGGFVGLAPLTAPSGSSLFDDYLRSSRDYSGSGFYG